MYGSNTFSQKQTNSPPVFFKKQYIIRQTIFLYNIIHINRKLDLGAFF